MLIDRMISHTSQSCVCVTLQRLAKRKFEHVVMLSSPTSSCELSEHDARFHLYSRFHTLRFPLLHRIHLFFSRANSDIKSQAVGVWAQIINVQKSSYMQCAFEQCLRSCCSRMRYIRTVGNTARLIFLMQIWFKQSYYN